MSNTINFKFAIGDQVEIVRSRETGTVLGVYKLRNCEAQAFVEYVAADGRCVERWWNESQLEAA